MTGEGAQDGNGYEHAGGYQPQTRLYPSWREVLSALCTGVATLVVTSLYDDYLAEQNRHYLGLAAGLSTLALSLLPRRFWQASDVRRSVFLYTFTIVATGFLHYVYVTVRDAGGWG